LKTLVRNEALQMGEPPSLRFVFETSEQIEINLLKEKAAMGFLKREEKCGNTDLVFFCSKPQVSTKTGSLKFGNK
jgi:hypothetical protein